MKTLLAIPPILFIFTTNAAIAVSPCGLNGSIEQRISDCHQSVGIGDEFQLVTRTKSGLEIYQGYRTGVIWSEDLAGKKNYLGDGVEDICKSAHAEFGGLGHLKWELPPIHRYIQALEYGIQSSLPGMARRNYWTSTSDDFYVTSRYIFEGSKKYKQNGDGMYIVRHLETDLGLAHVKCIVETL